MQPAFIFYDRDKKRKKKVNKYLRISIGFICLTIVIFSLAYFIKIDMPRSDRTFLNEKDVIDEISARKEDVIEVANRGGLVEVINNEGENYLVRKELDEDKKVLLTFDDGPDHEYTYKILDVLGEEDVPGTFFVVGQQLVRHPGIARRILDEGHGLGLHTYSHPSNQQYLYSDIESVAKEFDLTQKIIVAQTGLKSKLFRIPHWGQENTVTLNTLIFATIAYNRGYDTLSVTADSRDWLETDSEKIIENSTDFSGSQIILMHDSGGDRTPTVESLKGIIHAYKDAGYEFVTAEEMLGEGYTYLSKPTFLEILISKFTYLLLWLQNFYIEIFRIVFASALWLVGSIMVLSVIFGTLHVIRNKNRRIKRYFPSVSILIPAYNEEHSIQKTLNSVLDSIYPKYEVIVIDNNSTDETSEKVTPFLKNKRVKLIFEPTQGKYAALNAGISQAKGSIIVIVDADSQFTKKSLFHIVQPFRNKKIGAVSGNVIVGNVKNILTAFQQIEYTLGIQIDRRMFDLLGTTLVIPGAMGAWRKKVILEAGGYTNDTLVEDADLTVKIQRLGHKTAFAEKAVCLTEAPQDLYQYFRQRQRWTFGILQVLYKNRDCMFDRKSGYLGSLLIPYTILIGLPGMVIAPFIEIFSVTVLIFNPQGVLLYLAIFILVYQFSVLYAFVLSGERRLWLLLLVPFMRVTYQSFWYVNLYWSLIKAFKGEYVPWNKLNHLGIVELTEKSDY